MLLSHSKVMNLFEKLPKEIVFIIVDKLSAWSALNLRQTNRELNRNVMQNQKYWYRQFTLYLIRQNKRVALFKTGCKRTHKSDIPLTVNCLTSEQEANLAEELNINLRDLASHLENSTLTTAKITDCQNPLHFVYEVPKVLSDIPIVSADFHPNEQIYLYRFLIHNYRTRRDKVKRFNLDEVKSQKREAQKSLKRAEAAVEKHRKKIQVLNGISKELKLTEKNKVFFGSKSRQYRGL